MTVAELIAAGGEIERFRNEIKLRAASRCQWGWSPSSASARLIRNLEEAARAKGVRLATVKAATEGEINSERLLTAHLGHSRTQGRTRTLAPSAAIHGSSEDRPSREADVEAGIDAWRDSLRLSPMRSSGDF
jgi:hypothetical protein